MWWCHPLSSRKRENPRARTSRCERALGPCAPHPLSPTLTTYRGAKCHPTRAACQETCTTPRMPDLSHTNLAPFLAPRDAGRVWGQLNTGISGTQHARTQLSESRRQDRINRREARRAVARAVALRLLLALFASFGVNRAVLSTAPADEVAQADILIDPAEVNVLAYGVERSLTVWSHVNQEHRINDLMTDVHSNNRDDFRQFRNMYTLPNSREARGLNRVYRALLVCARELDVIVDDIEQGNWRGQLFAPDLHRFRALPQPL